MEFKAPSGAKVKINAADWKSSMALKSAIAKEVSKTDIDFDFKSITSDADVTDMIKLFMSLDSSNDVYDALFACLARCTHNGERITEELFEDVNNRQDYYDIAFNCIKENLSPFFAGLRSRLSQIMETVSVSKSEGQKSK